MAKRIPAKITGIAGYLPPRVLTNADLEKMVDTTDAWIRERTGISERHLADKGIATSDLAAAAAREVLRQTGTAPEEIDLIVTATVTPDMMFPATSCLVQNKLGATHAWGFDLSAACSGFLYALTVGAQFAGAGTHKKVLVIGSDVMSSIIDYKDRNTCVLFGDGAGAVLHRDRPKTMNRHPRLPSRYRRLRRRIPVHARRRLAPSALARNRRMRICTSSIRPGRTYSSMPFAAWPKSPASSCSKTASLPRSRAGRASPGQLAHHPGHAGTPRHRQTPRS